MKRVDFNQGSLVNHLNKWAELVKEIRPSRLFYVEPDWKKLKTNQCPVCGNKLIFLRGRPVAMCKGKRHGDKRSFTITLDKLAKAK